jgi:hypothetical protein
MTIKEIHEWGMNLHDDDSGEKLYVFGRMGESYTIVD